MKEKTATTTNETKTPILRFKTCEIMQYFKYYDVQEIAVIKSRVESLTNIKKYAIIIHDKDLLESGEPKGKHFHIVCTFSNMTTSQVVANVMKVEPQYVSKIKTTTKTAMLYLVHRNNPEKFQYEPSEVVANFDYVEYVDGCEPKQHRESIAKRIEIGEIKGYNLYDHISIDEYGKNKVYYDRCFEYRQNKIKRTERDMECNFITGASGTGKSTLAKMLAEAKGYKTYVSSGGKNPLDNYKGEECIILDDLRDSIYKLSDFLKLTDNNTDSLVGCRFYNKSIAECKLLIVTSIKDIHDFYFNATVDEKEPQVQLFRRFKAYVKMYPDYMELYDYDEKNHDFTLQYKCENPVSEQFKNKVAQECSKKIVECLNIKVINETQPQQQQLKMQLS